MLTSDYIAIVAVIVSIISIVVSIYIYNNQKTYIKTQHELNKLLLEKERKEVETLEEAFVSANVVKLGTGKNRIRIFNKGKGRANNVNISYPEDHNWLITNRIFPLEFLDSGQSVEMILSMYMGSQSKIRAILTWNDKAGEKTNEVILTYL
ncbi:hypothetical protein EHQ43_17580 [Leptospira bouyouniensis]|uniref:Uncharacterized protein n=1 Tax=Leptospira bouyouniensis TaxID=2484911 RepID=A0A7I0HM56_9LEPT|nr:hypothetical protein [Leptospira bouyouniensis]TGL02170.1 hypothetical protein EHQ43_17580 [Leptospira bouyouniensis]